MPRNYDTTTSRPYPRVTEVILRYSESSVPSIEYVEQMAVIDADRTVRHLAAAPTRHVLDLTAITEPVQVVHPATGLPIEGKAVTRQDLLLGLLAFLRADQLRRDAQTESAE